MDITGNQIIDYRKSKGLTQGQLAKQIGIALRTIQNYESGQKIPKSKLPLFTALFESEQIQTKFQAFEMDPKTLKKFEGISKNEIVIYVITHKQEFMNNPMFTLFIDKISHERALKIIKEM